MHTAVDRLEFAPPATPGVLRAMVLALLAHGLLLAALTWGVHWQRDVQMTPAEAELWAAMPVAAAPALQQPEPKPEPPQPKPEPLPPPPTPVAPAPLKVDIALAQEKQRLQKQKQLALEKQQEKLKSEKLRLEKLQQEKAREDKLKADKLKQAADKTKLAQDKKLAEQQAQQLEAQRAKNLQRMTGLAGASGASGATGTALKSAGPSGTYAGRLQARIKPNIVFTEDINGNPTAVVSVRTSADGTIIARRLAQSSGVAAWDEAVLRAIDKTAVLPRDTDGRVPSPLEISFRPKD
ncbi:cell envelope integrity protein TolA [Rhodoferax sp.]|uniref:cell envelope integrity protein TolA n=1 Tax=Rhodoferax sp. TaxID=50421 RepID=UPI0027191386|nr:cell envelope integrity protein TolA [Rhodoferax sp.]MDO8318371.1 cell envelope integrity protein TolA [Rhodoferax sp.]